MHKANMETAFDTVAIKVATFLHLLLKFKELALDKILVGIM